VETISSATSEISPKEYWRRSRRTRGSEKGDLEGTYLQKTSLEKKEKTAKERRMERDDGEVDCSTVKSLVVALFFGQGFREERERGEKVGERGCESLRENNIKKVKHKNINSIS